MTGAEVWKDKGVAEAFLTGRALLIPDRHRQLAVLLRVVRFFRPEPRRILDLGAGDGILLAALLEAFSEASGVAVDFSAPMLEQARSRLARFGARATTREADLQDPKWKQCLAGEFDVVVSGFAIHHLAHDRKQALYQEVHDLLADGGVFLNVEHVASPTPDVEHMFDDLMAEHLCLHRTENGESVTLPQVRREYVERPDRAANILAPVEEQCQWLRRIGFQEVDCFWKLFELAVFGGVKRSEAGRTDVGG